MYKFAHMLCAIGISANGLQALAAPLQTFGAGSAVTRVDRTATFDAVVDTLCDVVLLSAYSEGALRITVNEWAFTDFDPTNGAGGFSGGFHYPCGGASLDTSISTTDAMEIYAIEFNVADGYNPNVYNQTSTDVDWTIIKDSMIVGSGATTVARGSVIGFFDVAGFDELWVADHRTFGDRFVNAIAIDNVVVQLSSAGIPEPATLALVSLGLAGLGFSRRKQ